MHECGSIVQVINKKRVVYSKKNTKETMKMGMELGRITLSKLKALQGSAGNPTEVRNLSKSHESWQIFRNASTYLV